MIYILRNNVLQLMNVNRLGLLILYMIYYLLKTGKRHFLQYHKSKENYIKKMKCLHQQYKTNFITSFGVLQSYLQLYRIVQPIKRKSYRLKVPYDGEIVLDVCENTNDLKKNVLLIHGFNGSSNSKYIIGLSHHFENEGYKIFCFNARGTKEILNNSIFFHIGWTLDLTVAIEFILHNFSGSLEIYGFSMGANWVTKYLGKENLNPRIIKGGAICLPFDFYEIEKWMKNEKWVYKKRLFNRLLAYNFCKYIRRNKETFKNAANLDLIFKCKSLREIDKLLTKKIFNIKNLSKYYKKESAVKHLKNIKVPFLILNSSDDPIIPEFIINKKECQKNKNILLIINPWGGHLGFLKNNLRQSLADEIILEFSKYFN
ncbi:alpha/beta-hydrolases superfamily protein [Vairimorpha necatrix]|uniref:Alpha/beta-hydrolases superfamily protein n=1 Tax=Vairimorpha necatrix TaxID=6039 RepID=A0AAX4JAV8_9MICR